MASSLTASDRRALTIGALTIAAMTTLGLGLPTLRDWRASSIKRAQRESVELMRLQGGIAMNRQRTDVLMHLRKQLAEHDSTFLPGATAASAGTALEEVISEAAEGTSAEVGSIQVRLDTIGESRLEHVTARANVSGDIESLVLFLESIEAGPPTLAIREWSITGGSASLSPTQREMLRLDLVVEGLSRRIVRGRPR